MKPDKVSIVLPTYNGAKYLRESIDSILGQTYGPIELIVVNDASTDETRAILETYRDSRIRTITNSGNLGLPESLNVGFREATGMLFTWTSDDNRYAPDAIAKMASFLGENETVGLVYTGWHVIDETGNIVETRSPGVLGRFATRPWNPVGACFLYRREVADRIGPYEPQLRLVEDYDYWLRIYEHYPTAIVDEPLYFYRAHANSLSSRFKGIPARMALHLLLTRNHISTSTYRYWMAWLYQDEAYSAWKQQGNRLPALGLVLRSVWYRPATLNSAAMIYTLLWSVFGPRAVDIAYGLRNSLRNYSLPRRSRL